MVYLIYFIIVMFATTVGSLSGMGGGVIIKPSLDALSFSSLENINFYSSLAVLSMSIVSILKKYRQGETISFNKLLAIGIGSIIGGKIGNTIFKMAISNFPDDNYVKLIQIIIVVVILSMSVYYTSFCNFTFNFKNSILYFLISMLLGIVSTFLGIGGGPINVSAFILLFGIGMKDATLYSIGTIFFSQLSKNINDFVFVGLSHFELMPLLFILPAAILGGNLGTKINIKSSNEFVKKAYNIITISVILLNIINAIRIIGGLYVYNGH